jgi:hypothetical protein
MSVLGEAVVMSSTNIHKLAGIQSGNGNMASLESQRFNNRTAGLVAG